MPFFNRLLILLMTVVFTIVACGPVSLHDEGSEIWLASHATNGRGAERIYAFVNVNVVTMESDTLLEDQTVVIIGRRITAVGAADQVEIPPGAVAIPGNGLYLMPGLCDMHVHLKLEAYLHLLLVNGVTTVRNMDGRLEHLEWRQQIADGLRIGPSIFTTGPIIDQLPRHLPDDRAVETAEGAARIVAEQKALGYDFIKVYDGLSPTAYANIMVAAQQADMPVVGHVPDALSAMNVIVAGQRSIEHMDSYFGVYEDQLPALLEKTVDRSVWNCPTLIVFQRFEPAGNDTYSAEQRSILAYMPDHVLDTWWLPREFSEIGYEYRQVRDANLQMVERLHAAGALLMLGTDAPMPCAVPGFSVHRELQNLVDAGLSPFEALRTATYNPALFLNQLDEMGTISAGKQADLVLLDTNPLADIANTSRIVGVMVKGRWLPQEVLKEMLD